MHCDHEKKKIKIDFSCNESWMLLFSIFYKINSNPENKEELERILQDIRNQLRENRLDEDTPAICYVDSDILKKL